MSFNPTATIKTELAARLGQAEVDMDARWTTIIAACLTRAYQEIYATLLGRGYTSAQVLAWDRGAEFELDIALYHCLIQGAGVLHNYPLDAISTLNRIPELAACVVTNSWVVVGDPGVETGALDDGQVFETDPEELDW